MDKSKTPTLKNFDSLFGLDENDAKGIKPTRIILDKLKPFHKHPFKGYSNDKLESLAQSIKEQGVFVPILVRPIEDKKYDYEIVAGHNRVEGSKLAGEKDIPCIVREMDDETATILMVDSNLQQRETILPSEKAWAYKYKLDAIKKQGKRNDLTSCQHGKKLSAEIISEDTNDSWRSIYRYIKLTKLIPELLQKVDERKLALIPAVELSNLKKQEQKELFAILSREEFYAVPQRVTQYLGAISKNGNLTYEKIDDTIVRGIEEKPKNFKVSLKKVNTYFSVDTTPREFEDTIVKALDLWFEKHPKNNYSATKDKTR